MYIYSNNDNIKIKKENVYSMILLCIIRNSLQSMFLVLPFANRGKFPKKGKYIQRGCTMKLTFIIIIDAQCTQGSVGLSVFFMSGSLRRKILRQLYLNFHTRIYDDSNTPDAFLHYSTLKHLARENKE